MEMNKILKCFYRLIIIAILIVNILITPVYAVDIVTSSGVWYRNGANMLLNPSTLHIGSASAPIAKVWVTDFDIAGTFTFGGVMASNLDIDGYNIILDTDGDTAILNDRDGGVADDEFDIQIGGAVDFTFGVNTLNVLAGSQIHLADDSSVGFGNTPTVPDSSLTWNTAQTVDGVYLGLATAQNTLVIAEEGDKSFDFAHGAQATPTVFVHSNSQGTTKWLSLTHDDTDGLIKTGAGQLNLDPAANIVAIPGAVGTGAAKRLLIRTAANGTAGIELGEGNISTFYFRAMHTEDQGVLALSSQIGNQLVLTTNTNVAKDHDHASQTNPTWFIHSATDPDTDNTEWVSWAHDGSNAIIGIGKGGLVFGQGTKNDGYVTRKPAEVQTADATQTTLDSITLLDENTYHFDVWVVGVQSTGANRASYQIACTGYRTGAGVATLQGSPVSIYTNESNAAWDATCTVSGNTLIISVTGAAGATVEWGAVVRYMNMSS